MAGAKSKRRAIDGILIFDTGATDETNTDGCSAMVEYALDTEAWTAELLWRYTTEDCVYTEFWGNAEALDNDNRMIVLGTAGQIDEVTADQTLVWRMFAPTGITFGYVSRVGSLYP